MPPGIISQTSFVFQSAPHFSSEANALGLRARRQRSKCFNPRLTSAARRTHLSISRRTNHTFQSAPHFSSEANVDSPYAIASGRVVSIRASLQQRGELLQLEFCLRRGEFQSAPHFSSEANI